MNHRRHTDTRDEVDGIVNRHQRDYSLGQMQRVGLTPALFFRTDATGPVQQHRRRSTD